MCVNGENMKCAICKMHIYELALKWKEGVPPYAVDLGVCVYCFKYRMLPKLVGTGYRTVNYLALKLARSGLYTV